jgi:UPF0271 protein
MPTIDLNADLGESFGPWRMGSDVEMLGVVTSANIACGGHASDPETMYETLKLAHQHHVVVGAHPGYNDKEGFGRRIIPMSPEEIGRMLAAQVGALMGIASLAGTTVRYVKPHGALGNLAAADQSVADAIVASVKAISNDLAILAISGGALEQSARRAGLNVYSEIFADRAYQPNGQLVPRSQPGAVLHDAEAAAQRLLDFLGSGRMPVIGGSPIALEAHSICVHGDGATAVAMARRIRERLLGAGLALTPFIAP